MSRSCGLQFRGSRCPSAYSSGVHFNLVPVVKKWKSPISTLLVHILLPRFQSSVVLIDCWKDCYRREEEEEVNEQREARL